MSIPDYQGFMLPLLSFAGDGQEHSVAEARLAIADAMGLQEEDLAKLLPSGQQPVYANRLGWAKMYLEQAGLLEKTRRAYFHITSQGLALLREKPAALTMADLKRFESFEEFLQRSRPNGNDQVATDVVDDSSSITPDEQLRLAYEQIRNRLAQEILDQVRKATPDFFETLVVDLLIHMGYGGSRAEAGTRTERGADGGIDGIINEDRLGLDVIYLQAKRWEASVGRPEIQKFVGALHGHRAKKGVFLTTSTFTREASDYVAHIDPKVVLIDGNRLAQLMIDFNVGVSTVQSYEIKRIDSDYFAEE